MNPATPAAAAERIAINCVGQALRCPVVMGQAVTEDQAAVVVRAAVVGAVDANRNAPVEVVAAGAAATNAATGAAADLDWARAASVAVPAVVGDVDLRSLWTNPVPLAWAR